MHALLFIDVLLSVQFFLKINISQGNLANFISYGKSLVTVLL